MRSFIAVPARQKDSGKQYIIDRAAQDYQFTSSEGSQNRRSNATDAFWHAVIGSIVFFLFSGKDLGEFSPDKGKVLHGDGKKMDGLLVTERLYHDCPWAQFQKL